MIWTILAWLAIAIGSAGLALTWFAAGNSPTGDGRPVLPEMLVCLGLIMAGVGYLIVF